MTIPLHVLEEHHEAFLLWQIAIRDGVLPARGNTLLHVDDFPDDGVPRLRGSLEGAMKEPLDDLDRVQALTFDDLGSREFIVPAAFLGVFDEIVWIRPEAGASVEASEAHQVIAVSSRNGEGRALEVIRHPVLDGRPTRGEIANALGDGHAITWRAAAVDQAPPVTGPGTGRGVSGLVVSAPVVLDIDLAGLSGEAPADQIQRIEVSRAEFEAFERDRYHWLRIMQGNRVRMEERDGRCFVLFDEHRAAGPAPERPGEAVIYERVAGVVAMLARHQVQPRLISIARSRHIGAAPADRWELIERALVDGLRSLYDIDVHPFDRTCAAHRLWWPPSGSTLPSDMTVARLIDAVRAGDLAKVNAMLDVRQELARLDVSEHDERRALHEAVRVQSPAMVRALMRRGADARKGVYPHRKATSALTMARERGDDALVAVIEEEERREEERRATRNRAAGGSRLPSLTSLASLASQTECLDAIWSGDGERARASIERDPMLMQARDHRGWTPLHVAASEHDERMVAWLLERGAAVNQPGPDVRTPLDIAVDRPVLEAGGLRTFPGLASLLLQHGAQMTARAAVALGDAAWVRARLAEGSLVERPNNTGGLVSVAVRYARPDLLALLLDAGFDPDERQRVPGIEIVAWSWGQPLQHCARLSRYEMAETLLARGADPNGHVYAGGTVMYCALEAENARMVALLERHGGFADAATAGYLRLVDRAARLLDDEAHGRLREGAFLKANGTVAQELLWAAMRSGDPAIVRMALARVRRPAGDPRWALWLSSALPHHATRAPADRERYLSCFADVLRCCDASVRHGPGGRTVLHDVMAIDAGAPAEEALAFATLLLDAGARLDARDDLLESTPLGWACRWGRAELVELLLARGADAVERDAAPWATPWAWAAKMRRPDVQALLREHGHPGDGPRDMPIQETHQESHVQETQAS